MSTLVSRIDDEIKNAMRAKEALRLNTLRMLKSAVKYASIEKHGADGVATDEEVIVAIRKEIKKRDDSVAAFSQAGRTEAADNERAEIRILQELLPAALSEAEVEAIVKAAIAEVGATTKAQMGAVMKLAAAKAAGRVDGKTLSGLVGRLLP
jgi:uncharacterized protein YqeY